MRRLLLAFFISALATMQPTLAVERWEELPPTPAPGPTERKGQAEINGISVYYAIYGHGAPVILLHGGLANSDYWGHQVKALVDAHHAVILMDSRGHGRSTRDSRPFGYDLMADDVVALMDNLKIARADIVGWSDGGILGLDIAMRYADRVGKVVAFGANTVPSGVKENIEKNPTVAAFIARAGHEYRMHSATPTRYDAFVDEMLKMYAVQPNWSEAQLKTIKAPVLIVDGDHDEAIKREHTEYMAETIPGAKLVIIPDASHFAMLQNPDLFNAIMLKFLDN